MWQAAALIDHEELSKGRSNAQSCRFKLGRFGPEDVSEDAVGYYHARLDLAVLTARHLHVVKNFLRFESFMAYRVAQRQSEELIAFGVSQSAVLYIL